MFQKADILTQKIVETLNTLVYLNEISRWSSLELWFPDAQAPKSMVKKLSWWFQKLLIEEEGNDNLRDNFFKFLKCSGSNLQSPSLKRRLSVKEAPTLQ